MQPRRLTRIGAITALYAALALACGLLLCGTGFHTHPLADIPLDPSLPALYALGLASVALAEAISAHALGLPLSRLLAAALRPASPASDVTPRHALRPASPQVAGTRAARAVRHRATAHTSPAAAPSPSQASGAHVAQSATSSASPQVAAPRLPRAHLAAPARARMSAGGAARR